MSKAIATADDLYPIKDDPEFVQTARLLMDNSDRDIVGHLVLSEKLAPATRQRIAKRREELERGLIVAQPRDIRAAILKLMVSYGSAQMTADEASVIVAAYVSSLSSENLPLFAIERACLRFRTGAVKPEEVGEKFFSQGYRPSSAQLCIIARKVVQPYRNEFHVANELLSAQVGVVVSVSPEERERAAKLLRDTAAALRTADSKQAMETRGRQEQHAAWVQSASTRAMLEQYDALGIEPVQKNGVVTSLALLKANGWTIQTVGDRNYLLTPDRKRYVGGADAGK